jgi:hypothetical protein
MLKLNFVSHAESENLHEVMPNIPLAVQRLALTLIWVALSISKMRSLLVTSMSAILTSPKAVLNGDLLSWQFVVKDALKTAAVQLLG